MLLRFILTSNFVGEVDTPRELFSWGNNTNYLLGQNDQVHRSSPTQVGTEQWKKVSVGRSTTVAIDRDYQIYHSGKKLAFDDPQEVLTDSTILEEPTLIDSIGNDALRWRDVAVGESHIYAISLQNHLYALGNNVSGQLSTSNDSFSKFNWKEVALGTSHAVAIRSDGLANGYVYSWGSGDAGELGNNGVAGRSNITVVSRYHSWSQLSAGNQYTAGIRDDGTLWTWGKNTHGQLGDNTREWRSSPVQIDGSWTKVSTGRSHTVAIRNNGTIWSWGINQAGHLGQINRIHRSSPIQIGTDSWVNVDCGANHTLAVRSDGLLFTWGVNAGGQLGNNSLLSKSSPTQIGSSSWSAVAGGFAHSAAITTDGILNTWGLNDVGQLGDGTISTVLEPTPLSGSWSLVDAGDSHTIAINTSGDLYATGLNTSGQLGDGTTTNKSTLTIVPGSLSWISAKAGGFTTAGVTNNEYLYAWGNNANGQIADGTTTNVVSPWVPTYNTTASFVQIGNKTWSKITVRDNYAAGVTTEGAVYTFGEQNSNWQGNVQEDAYFYKVDHAPKNYIKISTGKDHGAGIRSDGTLWLWGDNFYGQLATGDVLERSSATQLSGSNTWVDVTCGYSHTLAVRDDGTLWGWGSHNRWQLASVPQYSWTDVVSSTSSPGFVYAAVRSDGSLYMWGDNQYGQLGTGDVLHRSSPVQIATDVAEVDTFKHTIVRKTDGTIWTWGWNPNGQLGTSDVVSRSSPVQVGEDTDWSQIGLGHSYSVALKSDGSLYAWGWNGHGVLAQGNRTNQSSPVQVAPGESFAIVGSGQYHCVAIKPDNTLWAWGYNAHGQLGQGNVVHRSSIVQVGASAFWIKLWKGTTNSSYAIRDNNRLYAWGLNSSGQLGNGTTTSALTVTLVGPLNVASVFAGVSDAHITTTTGLRYATGFNGDGRLSLSDVANKSAYTQVGLLTGWDKLGGYISTINENNINMIYGTTDSASQLIGDIATSRYSSPVQIPSLVSVSYNSQSSPVQIGSDSWIQVSTKRDSSFGIDSNYKLYGWGFNINGQLGVGDSLHRSSPAQIGNSSWTFVSAGESHTSAIRLDGGLFTWGENGIGQLGILGFGSIVDANYLNQVGISSWQVISTGVSHTAAIKADGTLWAWGFNNFGQLGVGYATTLSSPVQVGSDTNWSQVATNQYSTIATKTDGTLWSWGYNDQGQLGQNDLVHRSSPTQIGSDTDWEIVSGSKTAKRFYAIKTNKELYAWGNNLSGSLGTNDVLGKISPVQIPGSWNQISSGDTHTVAIDANNHLYGWGNNTSGKVGDFDAPNHRSSPVQISSDQWSKISAGANHSLAIRQSDGKLFAWGIGTNGELGYSAGQTINYSTLTLLGPPTEEREWSKVSTGQSHTLAIRNDGSLWAWGFGGTGALAQNNPISYSSPIQIGSTTDWTDIVAGDRHSVALKDDGSLWIWGENIRGQLGTGDTITTSSPVQLGSESWNQIAAGKAFTMAKRVDGTIYVWGENTEGQLGTGDTDRRSSPVQISGSWTSIATGLSHALAIANTGLLYAWGINTQGQLGDRTEYGAPTDKIYPTRVEHAESGVRVSWTQISTAKNTATGHTVAIRSDGTLWGWGLNTSGQLGDSTIVSKSSPVQIGSESNWTSVDAGALHTVARKDDSTIYVWGNNGTGRLGDGTTANKSSPVQLGGSWSIVKAGFDYTMGIQTDGLLYAWGVATNGKLGITRYPALISQSVPTHIDTHLPESWSQVSVGANHTLSIKSDGTLWAWGLNTNGALGQSNRTHRSSPVQIGSASNWIDCSAGNQVTLVRNAIGAIFSCGLNTNGQLGHNNVIPRSALIQIGALGYNAIHASKHGPTTVAIRSDGLLFVWGEGSAGQIGNNAAIDRSSPTQIGGETWEYISAGASHTIAVRSDITLWTWGQNTDGQLGDNTVVNKSSPVQITSFGNWYSIAGGAFHTTGVLDTGELLVWGKNDAGQLGLNDVDSRSSPTQVGTESWVQVRAGVSHTVALKEDNTIWAWGSNSIGQVGDGTLENRSSPVQVANANSWTSIDAGGVNSASINANNYLFAWGDNSDGRAGFLIYPALSNITFTGPELLTQLNEYDDLVLGQELTYARRTTGEWYAWGLGTSGQIGDGEAASRSSPVQVGSWSQIAIGSTHTAGIKTDGSLWTWGLGTSGQLGHEDAVSLSSPVQVGEPSSWVSVAAGDDYTIAVRNDGELFAWGITSNGRGIGNIGTNVSSPVQISTINSLDFFGVANNFATVVTGASHSAAITNDNTLWMWGLGTSGEIAPAGDGVLIARSSPIQVGFESWTQVYAGGESSYGVRDNEWFYGWGLNTSGQIGDGTIISKSSPVQIASSSAPYTQYGFGASHSVALKSDGSVWLWGASNVGQHGDGNTVNKSSPTQIGLSSWVFVDSNLGNHLGLIHSDNKLYFTGLGTSGQLGLLSLIGSSGSTSSPTQIGLSSWSNISAGEAFSIATNATGNTLWGWGYATDVSPRFGDGTIVSRSSPVQIDSNDWSVISAGDAKASAILTSNNTLWTWGDGFTGQLFIPLPTIRDFSSPVQVGGQNGYIYQSWITVSSGDDHTLAIREDNNGLYAFGRNSLGQLGTNNLIHRSSPVQIGTSSWTAIGASLDFSVGIDANGYLYSWGNNAVYQLGDDTTVHRSSPVQIESGFANGAISLGLDYSAALNSNNKVYFWGDGD